MNDRIESERDGAPRAEAGCRLGGCRTPSDWTPQDCPRSPRVRGSPPRAPQLPREDLLSGHDSYEAWREQEHDDLVLAVGLAARLAVEGRDGWVQYVEAEMEKPGKERAG